MPHDAKTKFSKKLARDRESLRDDEGEWGGASCGGL
jgi:hypothetical protein